MSKLPSKLIIAVFLVIAVLGGFAYYVYAHPQILDSLKQQSPLLLAVLLGCYAVFFICLLGVYNATLKLAAPKLPIKENAQLGIYSTLANFFLPLQSGPGVRAAYLKRRHQVPISRYIYANLIYYAMYAVISGSCLFIGSRQWWLAIPAAIGAALVSGVVLIIAKKRFSKKGQDYSLNLTPRLLITLFGLTIAQLLIQTIIYGIELHSVTHQFHPRDYLSYGGAANFSLFVSLTPGAIGFREAFLRFSQSLHHVSTTTIIAANLIDRGTYLVFLGILFILLLATHARQRIKGN